MDGREVKLRNALARIFEPHNPETWEHCDIPGRDRIDEAIREIDRERALERGQVRELHALLLQALDYEREAWDEDEQIEGGDLVEFFGEWRRRAEAAQPTAAVLATAEPPTRRMCACRAVHGGSNPTDHSVGLCPNEAAPGAELCTPCGALGCGRAEGGAA